MQLRHLYTLLVLFISINSCKKSDSTTTNPPPVTPATFNFSGASVNGKTVGLVGINSAPVLKFTFSAPIDHTSANANFSFKSEDGGSIPFTTSFENSDNTVVVQPSSPLGFLQRYTLSVSTSLKSQSNSTLKSPASVQFSTGIDSSDKFPVISDDALLTLVQQQTFKYFWDFGHPVSGLARERNSSGETVTSGGSGFGIMAIVTGVSRSFISRAEGLARMQKIVGFLKTA